ncbi:MAG: hypothetical protein QXS93_04490 [Candidatus Micrarchaeia archaeon]
MDTYVCAMLLLLITLGAAGTTFTVSIKGIDGARGRMISDNTVLDIGNCDMPLEIQVTPITMRMNYPSTCTGQMDVYYSYYDFSTGTYTDEKFACSISGNDDCKLTFNILFGGKGSGTEELDKWAVFRAVCRKSQEQLVYNMPLKIIHTETQFEKKLMPKVYDAEKSVSNAKAALAACPCCADKGYTATVMECERLLNSLKLRVAQCSFQNIENQFIDVKNMADNAVAQMGAIKCEPQQAQETQAETENNREENVEQENHDTGATGPAGGYDGKNTGIVPGVENIPKPAGNTCPVGALLIAVIGGLALARLRA